MPEGIVNCSAGSSLWNVQLIVLVPIGVRFSLLKEKVGDSGGIGPNRASSRFRKPLIARAILGSERHQAIFSKLRLANGQKLVIKIDVFAAQPRHFPDAEPQTIQQREDHLVGLSARLCSWVAGQLFRNFKKAACLVGIEEEWPPRWGDASSFT
jgi:hypothetical protein